MIGGTSQTAIYAWCEPTDMRRGFEGLSAMVRNGMGRDPLDGSLFLFTNRRRTHAKVLHFDGSGLCVFAKRIEKGRFAALWKIAKHDMIHLTKAELDLFLSGSHLVGKYRLAPDGIDDKDLAVRSRM